MTTYPTIEQTVGRTPLVRLQRMVRRPPLCVGMVASVSVMPLGAMQLMLRPAMPMAMVMRWVCWCWRLLLAVGVAGGGIVLMWQRQRWRLDRRRG